MGASGKLITTAAVVDGTLLAQDFAPGAVGQLLNVTLGGVNTSSTAMVKITGSDLVWTPTNKPVVAIVSLREVSVTSALTLTLDVYDGGALAFQMLTQTFDTTTDRLNPSAIVFAAAAGTGAHTYSVYWKVSGFGVFAQTLNFTLFELH